MGDYLLWTLLLIPVAGGAACLGSPAGRVVMHVPWIAAAGLAASSVGAAWEVFANGPLHAAHGWLFLDALSAYHLLVMAMVFVLSALCLPSYFSGALRSGGMSRRRAQRFGLLWCGTQAAMTLVLVSNNIGILWVGVEATTLVTAFLISTHRTQASLEAMWKYLIVCSVGIAFAFMGTLLVGAAADRAHLPVEHALLWTTLVDQAGSLDPALLKAGFLFLLVGYGAKAGIAPMHTWLPDAHSQAPAPVSALFSGFMLNAALYCIMRFMPILQIATGHSGWCLRLLLGFGLFSIAVAAAFIVFQRDVKRLLAYCSVEHLGIIAVGLGLGGLGVFAALFHTLVHSLGKTLAFLAAGRLGQLYGSHDMADMAGSMRAAPLWGNALFASMLALIGVAPFALFLSELLIVRAAIERGAFVSLGLFLAGTAVVFIGMLRHAIAIGWGRSSVTPRTAAVAWVERAVTVAAVGALLVLGVWMPDVLQEALRRAAAIVEGVQ